MQGYARPLRVFSKAIVNTMPTHPHSTNKVGVIPYRWSSARTESGDHPLASIEFLVHLPKPKNEGREAHVKWGVARGTVRMKGTEQDIRDAASLAQHDADAIEDHWLTAVNEMGEELGLLPENLKGGTIQDLGLIRYDSQTKPPYDIHFFTAEVGSVPLDTLKERATHSQDVAWMNLDTIRSMAARGGPNRNAQFRPGYVPILEQVAAGLAQDKETHIYSQQW